MRNLSVDEMKQIINAFVAAAEKFVEKVESGRARSHETYNDLKACLKMVK